MGDDGTDRRENDGTDEPDGDPGSSNDPVRITVVGDDGTHTVQAEPGTTLREALLAAGHSPYTAVTGRLNCGGRGICATCGVRLLDGPPPDHWHDRLADRFGYPRLSCQVRPTDDVTVRIPEKLVWGGREPDDSTRPETGTGDDSTGAGDDDQPADPGCPPGDPGDPTGDPDDTSGD